MVQELISIFWCGCVFILKKMKHPHCTCLMLKALYIGFKINRHSSVTSSSHKSCCGFSVYWLRRSHQACANYSKNHGKGSESAWFGRNHSINWGTSSERVRRLFKILERKISVENSLFVVNILHFHLISNSNVARAKPLKLSRPPLHLPTEQSPPSDWLRL